MGSNLGQFLIDCLAIVFIHLLLAGDNAVVIALAVRSLPPRERKIGITLGAGMAVVLRVILTFFAAQLLRISYIKLIGGLAILWIAVKLLTDTGDEEGGKSASTLWHAMWLIMVADVTMSTDNILAVAGASKGHFGLLIFGLGLSIPFVVFTSNLLSTLMDRYPIIIYLGAAVLGRVGGEMIMTDPVVVAALKPNLFVQYAVQAGCAVGVLVLGRAIVSGRKRREDKVTTIER